MPRISRAACVLTLLALAAGLTWAAAADEPARPPAIEKLELEKLIGEFKPPYKRAEGPADPAITFERIDVVFEPHFMGLGAAQSRFLSIGRDGSYLLKIGEATDSAGNKRPGLNLLARLSPERLKELQRLVEATAWLTAAGGEGIALHTDAATMHVAVRHDDQTKTVTLEGDRPQPYGALQKFFCDIAWQETMVYRLSYLPTEHREATYQLHTAIEEALGLPSRAKPVRTIDFARFEPLFAQYLDNWFSSQPDDLCTAIDLVLLLKRADRAGAVARLRFDRDSRVRSAVARALPVLQGAEGIAPLVEMIPSTADARWQLILLGEPAVPAIWQVIAPDESQQNPPSVLMIRAYIDHWKQLPQPVDPRIVQAVLDNMQREKVRDRMNYHHEFLKLAGVETPRSPTAAETIRLFLKHFLAGDRGQLQRLWTDVGNDRDWAALRAKLDLAERLTVDAAWVDDWSGMAISGPLKTKTGDEVHLVMFLTLLRGHDWRVVALVTEPADQNRQKDQWLKGSRDAKPLTVSVAE